MTNQSPDPFAEVLADLDVEDSRLWDPREEGETLVGEIVDILPGPNRASPTLVLETPEGDLVRVHLAASDLRDAYKTHQPGTGWLGAFRFKGFGTSASTGKKYRMYSVAFRPPAE